MLFDSCKEKDMLSMQASGPKSGWEMLLILTLLVIYRLGE